jgi:hypothetical protein
MYRLIILVFLACVPACAPISIVESPWKAAPEWSEIQHRLMADRLRAWLDGAQPVSSVRELAERLPLPGVVIVGESHDTPRYSKSLVRELLARDPSAEVWEEAVSWRMGPGPPRLQGLYSRQWRDGEGRRIIAGGEEFNATFARLATAGLPSSLIIYAGNAHSIHARNFDGPGPRTGGPLPADAADATGAHSHVTAIAVYPRRNLISHADLNMAVAIMAALSRGGLDVSRACVEAAWCEHFLEATGSELTRRGDFITEIGPGRFIASMGEGSTPWSLKTVTAVRLLLTDSPTASLISGGASVELIQRAVNNGIVGPAYEEFLFGVTPVTGAARRIRVTRRGVSPRRRAPQIPT